MFSKFYCASESRQQCLFCRLHIQKAFRIIIHIFIFRCQRTGCTESKGRNYTTYKRGAHQIGECNSQNVKGIIFAVWDRLQQMLMLWHKVLLISGTGTYRSQKHCFIEQPENPWHWLISQNTAAISQQMEMTHWQSFLNEDPSKSWVPINFLTSIPSGREEENYPPHLVFLYVERSGLL